MPLVGPLVGSSSIRRWGGIADYRPPSLCNLESRALLDIDPQLFSAGTRLDQLQRASKLFELRVGCNPRLPRVDLS